MIFYFTIFLHGCRHSSYRDGMNHLVITPLLIPIQLLCQHFPPTIPPPRSHSPYEKISNCGWYHDESMLSTQINWWMPVLMKSHRNSAIYADILELGRGGKRGRGGSFPARWHSEESSAVSKFLLPRVSTCAQSIWSSHLFDYFLL